MLKLKNVLLTNISTIQMGIKMRSLVTLHFIVKSETCVYTLDYAFL